MWIALGFIQPSQGTIIEVIGGRNFGCVTYYMDWHSQFSNKNIQKLKMKSITLKISRMPRRLVVPYNATRRGSQI
ncbi:hypothetical protein IEQ34_018595 [Dendrobium chrysotoxum]|uniref:Uncharacterized protein n=1 Tax=Dendrobium chrysotoxum TaxID=161865 RepID=A0AAV7G503_DENCH|nr:hypothetical protein IEQ34_018595 [Dendrobium chrysotoxum]